MVEWLPVQPYLLKKDNHHKINALIKDDQGIYFMKQKDTKGIDFIFRQVELQKEIISKIRIDMSQY